MARKPKDQPTAPTVHPGMPTIGMPTLGLPFGSPFFGLGLPQAILERRNIKTRNEQESIYELDDGTVLAIKPTLIDVK